jgi:ubiquinone/menaquinone biosynthesis C-methylase UbiE
MKFKYINYPTPVEVVKRVYSKSNVIKHFEEQTIWTSEKLLINTYFHQGDTILDIACGPGRTAIPLAQNGYKITGIDFIPEMLNTARCRAKERFLNIKLLLMDAVEMDFPDESFHNIVFLYNSFELIWKRSNRFKILKEVYRILKPGGYFILTSRSAFATGKRCLAWPWLLFRTYILKPMGAGNPHLELCDVFSRGTYHRYQSPFSIRRDLKNLGFLIILFNSDRNLQKNKKSTFLTNFSSDRCLFFVGRKPIEKNRL